MILFLLFWSVVGAIIFKGFCDVVPGPGEVPAIKAWVMAILCGPVIWLPAIIFILLDIGAKIAKK